jgi:hypothetical protein
VERLFLLFPAMAQRLLDSKGVERQDEEEGKLSSVECASGS